METWDRKQTRYLKGARHRGPGALALLIIAAFLVTGCGSGAPAATATPVPPEERPPDAELPALLSQLHPLGHASFRLDGPPAIYFDPTSAESDAPQADVILVSHDHNDHYAPATLKAISGPQTVILANERVAAKLANVQGLEGEVRVMQAGDVETLGEAEIEAVPAYNLKKSFHPRDAGGLGFVVTWRGERLYFAGDTDHIPEMAEIECDVALLPIGGTYTMDVEEAVQAAAAIDSQVFVPMHARGADPEQFRNQCDCTAVLLEP